MVTIYLDDDTKEILKKIKRTNEAFNLSNFIQAALYNHIGLGNENTSELYKRIADNKAKMDMFNAENLFLENKIHDIEDRKTKSALAIEQEIKDLNNKQKREEWVLSISPELETEYRQGLRDGKWRSYAQFYDFHHTQNDQPIQQ